MAMDNITLTSGMRQNLFSLQGTAKSMDLTQNRLSSGKKVNSALDDPIAFFAAQGHTQRSNDLAIRKDEMSEAIQTIKAADNGISAVLDLIASAKSLAQSALANQDATERGLSPPSTTPDIPDRHRGCGLQLQRHQPARMVPARNSISPLTKAATLL
jgi:hypothetical protein